jgi:hypothetical protein
MAVPLVEKAGKIQRSYEETSYGPDKTGTRCGIHSRAGKQFIPGSIGRNVLGSDPAIAEYLTLVRNHVTPKCCSIDRIFLQALWPQELNSPI